MDEKEVVQENKDKEVEKEDRFKAPCAVQVKLTEPPVGPREYIYNLIPRYVPQVISKYKCLPKIQPHKLSSEGPRKESMKTMGPPSRDHLEPVVYPDKRPFMKKQSKRPMTKLRKVIGAPVTHVPPEKPAKRKGCLTGPKPGLPTIKGLGNALDTDGIPLKCKVRERHKINWITRNAIAAITAEPGFRFPQERRRMHVDTRHGDKFALKSNRTMSGLEPVYVYRSGAGKVPTYLKRRSKLYAKTQDLLTHYINEKELQTTDYLLTEKQREDLLNGLKAAWDRYNRKYLGLASINDTLKGKAYKEFLEKQLDALKDDIELVESHQFLFIEAPKNEDIKTDIIKTVCA
ncbi:unnamed protein product [Calicophoron daubneyi]|uniref:Enkurin domain-containing protein n=1 Tax=Calicophoron daubneyi TaxID=300641 RepID=A0AAV2T9Z1_CALDB